MVKHIIALSARYAYVAEFITELLNGNKQDMLKRTLVKNVDTLANTLSSLMYFI
tara:strand:+ start:2888 stop:3049 length:162 start_codon:yes stop_codon:yes gene_type:complete